MRAFNDGISYNQGEVYTPAATVFEQKPSGVLLSAKANLTVKWVSGGADHVITGLVGGVIHPISPAVISNVTTGTVSIFR